jgi:hypothetical protein
MMRKVDMLTQSEFDQTLWDLEPRKRFIYHTGIAVQTGVSLIGCAGLVGGLSTLIARQLVAPGLGHEALIGAVIMPCMLAFLAVITSVRRNTRVGGSIGRTLGIALRDGLALGLIVGFVMIACWHYLGQLAMARAIYGSLKYQNHPDAYCGLRAAYYGLLFAVPVALGCGLFTAVFKVGPQVMLNLVNRLPDHT